MFLNEILYATQYYRAPTPLAEEWETDISKLGDIAIDTFQIRINWRWNERKEDEYDFSDIDRLMELAAKYNKKVIIKFLLECAPQYIFEKYKGSRIGSKGETLGAGASGAFYGGWRPCFTNPHVQARAIKFVEQVASRYSHCDNLLFWNAWNEIRNKPIEDCFCPHCRRAFGKYLQKKFGTIEALNSFYGTAEECFENIALPIMPHAYWDIFEFKKFKGGTELRNWLQFVYDAIRKFDATRPIMAHAGCTSAFQDSLCDVCDDVMVSKGVDLWGTSIPISTAMNTHENRLEYMLLLDFLRSVDDKYLLYEIYPGLGRFQPENYDTNFDMKFKLYAGLACGAKGFNFWQYRAERIGNEFDCAGLTRASGEPRAICDEVKKFGLDIKAHNELFFKAKSPTAEIAIVFDFDCLLFSEIEEHCCQNFAFVRKNTPSYYKNAHIGMYKLLQKSNYNVDYLQASSPEKFKNYKVLYFPYHTMLNEETVKHLKEFLETGGVALIDEGFGLCQPNTWFQPYDIACKPIMEARLLERRETCGDVFLYKGKELEIAPFKTEYRVKEAETLYAFSDGIPALQKIKYGCGEIYLFASSIGYSYQMSGAEGWKAFVCDLLETQGLRKNEYSDCENFIYEKRLLYEDREIVFIFNCSDTVKRLRFSGEIFEYGGDCVFEKAEISVQANALAYIIKEIDL